MFKIKFLMVEIRNYDKNIDDITHKSLILVNLVIDPFCYYVPKLKSYNKYYYLHFISNLVNFNF